MDISMPVLDGFQATREIRHSYPSIEIILLTVYHSSRAREEALNVGAFDFVEKPAIWTKLVPALRRVQQEKHMSAEPAQARHVTPPSERPHSRTSPQVALRDAEQRFLSTFEHTAVGMAHVAENGRWLRVNQKLCDIVGFKQR